MSSDVKQVKVANWGTYFLQRLKHFFNRTDYCDLTLQFQDNAQLKVHRLVLSACTEYFELLERTCEMYEDCLVMPDDLQADVVVPIVNFMYTGQLEFRMELLERLYQTSQILNLPVLTKLLKSHRDYTPKKPAQSYSSLKKYPKIQEAAKAAKTSMPTTSTSSKRSYSKAFDNNTAYKDKKVYHPTNKSESISNNHSFDTHTLDTSLTFKKSSGSGDPRPSRYELPEELDEDNIFDNSFCNISYGSTPLMVHPDTVKRYSSKKNKSFGDGSISKKFPLGASTLDIVECKKITKSSATSLYDDGLADQSLSNETEMFPVSFTPLKDDTKDSSQLFDQILDRSDCPKVTIDTTDNKLSPNIDHAKIISRVLKRYPHLVKSSKNIKLKFLNPQSNFKSIKKLQKPSNIDNTPMYVPPTKNKQIKVKTEEHDFTYETDVLDSKEAAKLIALGAENIKGPWICLICGTPGKAINFTSYYKFRRHLVEVHNEKPVSNICEYCGLKSLKRNYLLHHLYSQHGVQPPPPYNFPKCNKCNYIALTEGFLVKHKMTHMLRNFRCNVCNMTFTTSNQLLTHIQNTGHKYSGDRKTNLQCIYCLKVFLRESNLYAHLKTNHNQEAKHDGIIEDSDDEKITEEKETIKSETRFEPSTSYEADYEVDLQFQIQQKPDGGIQLVSRKQQNVIPKQKILNAGFGISKPSQNPRNTKNQPEKSEFLEDISVPSRNYEEIVVIDDNEYIMRDDQLIPRSKPNDEYILSDIMDNDAMQTMQPTTSMEYTHHTANQIEENVQQPAMILKKPTNIGQPIQIVVSSEEEYKALMASNHPIIIDNTDSNKTLTVLTAPHETTLEPTTIDLDKSQSNDMMILPEYPLNVTEAVSADNQNIVVMYSHPVHDQNKQFQIITTQGLGAQFVQSSAMITQNYETVTTSTPVMSAHVLDTQVDETWQNNVQTVGPQQVELPPDAELHRIVQSEHLEINPTQSEASNNIHDQNIITNEKVIVPLETFQEGQINEQVQTETIESIESAPINADIIPVVTESQQLLELQEPPPSLEVVEHQVHDTIAMETEDCNTETSVDKDMTTITPVLSNPVEAVPQMVVSNMNVHMIQEPITAEVGVTETCVEPTVQPEDIIDTPMEDQNTDVPENVSSETENIENAVESQTHVAPESPTYTEMADISPTPIVETACVREAEEKIQSLTSEWSEDEYDVPEDNQPAETIPKPVEEPHLEAKSPETEETIENIQQEVEKHMSIDNRNVIETGENIVANESHTQEAILASTEDIQESDNKKTAVNTAQADPQEKISSLLNDWEDNDSQEEGESVNNDSQEEITPVINDEPTTKCVDSATQNQEENIVETLDPKNDSIKKLVSDWDEDDEEDKD